MKNFLKKSLQLINRHLRDARGFSATQMVLSVGAASGMVLGLMNGQDRFRMQAENIGKSLTLQAVVGEMKTILSDPASCLQTLGGKNAANTPESATNIAQLIQVNQKTLVANNRYPINVEIHGTDNPNDFTDLAPVGYSLSDAASDVDAASGTTYFLARFDRGSTTVGMGRYVSKRIKLNVTVGPGNIILSCRVAAGRGDGIWVSTPTAATPTPENIYYEAGDVSIGQKLTADSSTLTGSLTAPTVNVRGVGASSGVLTATGLTVSAIGTGDGSITAAGTMTTQNITSSGAISAQGKITTTGGQLCSGATCTNLSSSSCSGDNFLQQYLLGGGGGTPTSDCRTLNYCSSSQYLSNPSTCANAPSNWSSPCPSNQYVKTINPTTGAVTCGTYTLPTPGLSGKSCPANQLAYHMNGNTNTLSCKSPVTDQTCPSGQYVTSIAPDGTITCAASYCQYTLPSGSVSGVAFYSIWGTNINGQGPVAKVKAGTSYSFTVDGYSYNSGGYCCGCISFMEFGLVKACGETVTLLGCFASGYGAPGQYNGMGGCTYSWGAATSGTYTAPTDPGIYYLRYSVGLDFYCGQGGWYPYDRNSSFGMIIVEP